jgi:hypothetical protein
MHETKHMLICLTLLAVWTAWCLFAIDWRKLWPWLAQGAWAPLVLIALMIAAVWAWMAPGTLPILGLTLPNFFWQLLAMGLIVGFGLFCGWLQGLLQWYPAEVELYPVGVHADDHAHSHGHHEAEGSAAAPEAEHGHGH